MTQQHSAALSITFMTFNTIYIMSLWAFSTLMYGLVFPLLLHLLLALHPVDWAHLPSCLSVIWLPVINCGIWACGKPELGKQGTDKGYRCLYNLTHKDMSSDTLYPHRVFVEKQHANLKQKHTSMRISYSTKTSCLLCAGLRDFFFNMSEVCG